MSRTSTPSFPENWTVNDLLTWINSRNETSKELLEIVDAEINSVQKRMVETKLSIDRITEEESVLEACGRLCFELRDRLKMVVEAQAKEQLAKEFDAIAVFDKADRRATDLANVIMARRTWAESVKIIESLEEGEPPPENVVFELQEAYSEFAKYVEIDEKKEFLERMKDIFLSWYSTRAVLILQSEKPSENLYSLKQKYDMLGRTEDFETVIRHFIKDQSKLKLKTADSLPDLFLDAQKELVSIFTRLREGNGWAERVLENPSQFITTAMVDSFSAQWPTIKTVLNATLEKTAEDDPTGAASLKMILALRQLLSDLSTENDDDRSLLECISDFGMRLLAEVARDYTKFATSFLATHSNIFVGSGPLSTALEQISNGLTQLIKESDYLVSMSSQTFANYAVIHVIPAFRSMYENVISLLSKIYKSNVEKNVIKDNDILRFVSIMGQVILWFDLNHKRLKEMLEIYQCGSLDPFMQQFSEKLTDDINSFDKKVVVKADCDLGITKSHSELRKLNKRVVTRAVEVLSYPIVSKMESVFREMKANSSGNDEVTLPNLSVPSFGTSPNDNVTAAGVALLSLAHQLSAHSLNSNMAASLASASKTEIVDDIASWWVEKCANSVQNCFIDVVGDVNSLTSSAGRQFAVDYVYLADVFEDLGTPLLPEFNKLRQKFMNLDYIKE